MVAALELDLDIDARGNLPYACGGRAALGAGGSHGQIRGGPGYLLVAGTDAIWNICERAAVPAMLALGPLMDAEAPTDTFQPVH